MTSVPTQRQPHAVLDLPSRAKKALKIERLLDLRNRPQPIQILEIGSGSGGIAHYFAHNASLQCQVHAVDVTDQRQVSEGYDFTLVKDTHLPFGDASFDVVLSNHVIEHVGEEGSQRHHLAEMHRVMAPDGVGYLAVPNRWMLVEPHYRLAFLSWLPIHLRTPYLKFMKRGTHYDCLPPTKSQLEAMLRGADLAFEFLSTKAIHEMVSIEGNQRALRFIACLPSSLLDWFAAINPTLIYRLRKRATASIR